MKKIVAITGGIGAGKTTVASQFASFGVPVYNSDLAAKRLMTHSKELQEAIVKLLGTASFLENGTLNKAFISDQIYKSEYLRNALNELVHPIVNLDFSDWAASFQSDVTVPYLLYESAILSSNQIKNNFFAVIIVKASEAQRIERVQKRDGRTEASIRAIMMAQHLPDIIDDNNTFVIINESLSSTLLKSNEIHNQIINRLDNK